MALVYGKLKEYEKAFKLINASIKDHKELDSNHPIIVSCNIYIAFLYFLKKDKEQVRSNFKKIKDIKSDADIGHNRHFELYQIYQFLGLDGSPFLKQAYLLLENDISCIPSIRDKKNFTKNIGYNKSILQTWEAYNNA